MTNAAKRWDEALVLLGVRRCPAARPWWVPGDLCGGAASAHSQQPATETPLEALGSLETFRIFRFFVFLFFFPCKFPLTKLVCQRAHLQTTLYACYTKIQLYIHVMLKNKGKFIRLKY